MCATLEAVCATLAATDAICRFLPTWGLRRMMCSKVSPLQMKSPPGLNGFTANSAAALAASAFLLLFTKPGAVDGAEEGEDEDAPAADGEPSAAAPSTPPPPS